MGRSYERGNKEVIPHIFLSKRGQNFLATATVFMLNFKKANLYTVRMRKSEAVKGKESKGESRL